MNYHKLGFNSYSEYLSSNHWRELRTRFYLSKLVNRINGCICCTYCSKSGIKLNLHHRTYKRLGKERLNDLVLICDDCHDRIHKAFKGKGLWGLTSKIGRRIRKKNA
jgi:5-methylcytosine-specific restriction endonuclease McrA